MNVSEIVTIRVKSPLWERRKAFAYPIPEFETYTGTVLPSPSWVGADEICISTGNVGFPFRVIEKARIVGCTEAREQPEEQLYQIEGTKGKLYPVTRSRGIWSCPCTGFGYRRSCSHVVIAKSKFAGNVSQKETIFFEKKQNQVLTSSIGAVEYMGKVETGASPYKMKVKTMAKVKSEAKVKVTKTSVVIDIMTKNAHLLGDEVARIIETQLPCREGYGKVWYRWAVKEGVAPGAIRDPKAPKAAKAASERQLTKRLKVEKAIAKAKFGSKSVDEIAKIKEANLERMREVSAKLKTKKVRDFGDRVAKDDGEGVADFDPALAREEIDSILRDERLIDVCPKFVREDA